MGVARAVVALLALGSVLAVSARAARQQAAASRGAAGVPHVAPLATRAPVAIPTVAVLPFVNTSGDPQDDYFSDGLTDELAHALTRLPGLRLAGRTSSFAFKGRAVAAQEIGRVLGVDAFVAGTVRRMGDRMRVTAQLVSTVDGTVRWDSVYETRSRDVFSVQDALTHAIVPALAPALGDRGAKGTEDPAADIARGTNDQEAYELYLKGRYNYLLRNPTRLARAVTYFQQAIARDPSFALAHAGLAMAFSVWRIYFPGPADSMTTLGWASAERAVTLDSTLADARFALSTALNQQLRFPEALAHYRAGLVLDPSSVAGHHGLGGTLLTLGRTDEALVELRLAARLDPLAHSAAGLVSAALLDARRFSEAAPAARHALSIDSTFAYSTWVLGVAQAFGGQPDSAIQTLERGLRRHPAHRQLASALVFAYAAAGRWADAARVREELHRPGGDLSSGVEAAVADLVFGDREPLVRLLTSEAGQRRYVASGGWFGCKPLFDPLWADARFRAAMSRLSVEVCPLARPWPLPPRPAG